MVLGKSLAVSHLQGPSFWPETSFSDILKQMTVRQTQLLYHTVGCSKGCQMRGLRLSKGNNIMVKVFITMTFLQGWHSVRLQEL